MNQIIIKTDNAANARKLADFLKSVRYVKSVNLNDRPLKPLKGADWIKPGRPATDEELEQMIEACEKSPSLSSEEARNLTLKEIREWKRKR